ncbi:MAG: SPOR domain-containing protein [Lysobacteraceae bacterium]
MAAKRGKSQARRGGGMKYGVVLVVGLLLGLGMAAAWMVYGDRDQLDALLPKPDPDAQAPAADRDREPVAQEPAKPEAGKPSYDFYTVLPEKQVELPANAEPAVGTATAPAPATATPPVASTATPAASTGGGQLQAGAFSAAADAEARRAKLALLGQTARIETVESGGRTLHRVRLGPYGTAAEREAAQRALAESGISATTVR